MQCLARRANYLQLTNYCVSKVMFWNKLMNSIDATKVKNKIKSETVVEITTAATATSGYEVYCSTRTKMITIKMTCGECALFNTL